MSIEEIKPDTSLYADHADRLIAFGLAMKSGKDMERRRPDSTVWEEVVSDTNMLRLRLELLANGMEYRVAPPKPREVWIIFTTDGYRYTSAGDEQEACRIAGSLYGTYAKFVEVM